MSQSIPLVTGRVQPAPLSWPCQNCGQDEFDPSVKTKPETRPVEGYPQYVEYGILCVFCGEWKHMCYMNQQLVGLRQIRDAAILEARIKRQPELTKKANQEHESYRRAFNRLQRRLRPKFNPRSSLPLEVATGADDH